MTDISSMNGVLVTRETIRSFSGDDLVLYLGATPLQPREIVTQIKLFLDRTPGTVQSISLVAPEFRRDLVTNVINCDDFIQLKAGLGALSHEYLFSRNGRLKDVDETQQTGMLTRILTKIVRARHGVLEGSGAVHYAKPSQKHTDQFIRAGNVVVNSVELELIAWGCLPHFKNDVGFVYTDTGAINSVAASVRDLLTGFRGTANFSVDSFGSYQGLDTFAGPTEGSIWLISATTSGSLAQRIVEKQRVTPEQIVCIFSLGVSNRSAVCHLDYHEKHNPQGFKPIRSYPPSDCGLCRAGSIPLWLTDEHFQVSDISVTPYLPTRNDLSKESLGVLNELVGNGVFRVTYQPNLHTERSDIFLDSAPHASQLLSEQTNIPKLANRFRRRVQQSLAAAVNVIVHLDDPASKALASALFSHIKSHGLSPTVIAAHDLPGTKFDASPETVVVVASTVASGTSVIDLSRTLRSISTVKSVSYFVLVDRSATEERARQTQQSVTITEDGHRYDYHVIARLPLPDPSAVTRNAWDDETALLQKLLESPSNDALRAKLEKRRDSLDAAKSEKQRGLQTNLFWPSENDESLMLSPGFVFLPTGFDVSSASQADVYSMIRCLLHSLRTKGKDGREPALRQHPLHRKVLDVGVFYRFNDPALQAAILRAAAPAELDYSYEGTGNQSVNARLLLGRIFKDRKAPAAEFALALAVGRLRITEDDKKQILTEVDALHAPLGAVTMAFLDAWKSR
ncbi:hypothetical protein [Corallococcus sp. Z5C101001]|uniref:hypothetical protein n=1 Tax=Corallococcus sp. Z5C101001 TaxID=2596829 RepID=UPI00117E2397|nr:hypothetical protein [Corallococcus sp. Z5C101001]TSC34445.1 hypothetical protein FOF48_05355 [Corallococcus sp. Z5C101001]